MIYTPATRITVERTKTYNGIEVMVKVHQESAPTIILFANPENIARLAKSMGIPFIEITCYTNIPSELESNEYATSGFALSTAYNRMPRYDTALDVAYEITRTLASDSAGKRGRKFIPHIRIIDCYNDKIVRESGVEIDGKKLLED